MPSACTSTLTTRSQPERVISRWHHACTAMTLRLALDEEEALALLAEAEGVSSCSAPLSTARA